MITGKQSKSIVANLASKYVEMSRSGPYQTNKASVDLIDMRITALLSRIEDNETPKRMKKIVSLWKNFKSSAGNMFESWILQNPEAQKSLKGLEEEIEKAYHDYESWGQVLSTLDLRRKITADEMRILEKMQALISVEDAYELSGQLLAAVITVLGDTPDGQKLLATIHSEFARILGESRIEQIAGREPETIDLDPR